MCGNDVSTVVNPYGDFHTLVSPQIPSRKINLKNYPLSQKHAMQLNSLNLMGVRELNIEKCKVNHQTMEALSRVNLPVLAKLNLADNELGPIGCRVLAGSALLSRLTELNLNNNKLKDVGIKALANADLLAIEDLSLNDNSVTSQGLASLGGGKLSSIECLSLGGNKLNDKSVALINAINPDNICFLKLSRNELTGEGVKQLVSQHKHLDVLLVERNKLKQSRESFGCKNVFLFF